MLNVFSNLYNVNLYGQIRVGFSDHDLIYISYNLPVQKTGDRHFYIRDFNFVGLNHISVKFYDLPWSDIYTYGG